MRSIKQIKAARERWRDRKRRRGKKVRFWNRRLVASQKRLEQLKKELEDAKKADLGARALMEAGRLVGVTEAGGNNRGPMVDRIIKYALGDLGEAWCVDFNIWCYGHAGSKIVKPGYTRAVRFMWPVNGIIKTGNPRPGDMVRFTFDHTGLYVKDNGDGTITTIEGNTGNQDISDPITGGVRRRTRAKSLVRDYLRVTG
jgi:hypothetical protein